MVEQPSPAPTAPPAGGAIPPEGAQQGQRPSIQSLLSSLSGAGTANASVRTVQRGQ